MLTLITGMFRSGSTWSYNVVRELLTQRWGSDRIEIVASDDVTAVLDRFRGSDRILIIKGHFLDETGRDLICRQDARVIHTFRDPAHAILSGQRAFGFSFEQSLDWVARSFEFWDLIVESRHGCLVFYDDIAVKPHQLIRGIAAHLEADIDAAATARIAEAYGRTKLEQFSASLQNDESDNIRDVGFSFYEKRTLLYRDHVSDGSYLRSASLSPAQQEALRSRLGPRLEFDSATAASRFWLRSSLIEGT